MKKNKNFSISKKTSIYLIYLQILKFLTLYTFDNLPQFPHTFSQFTKFIIIKKNVIIMKKIKNFQSQKFHKKYQFTLYTYDF